MAVVLEVRSVTVRRSDALLLDGVDLTVHEGERWVVFGPNGAGKTTLINILAGRTHPTKGSVEVLDELLGRTDIWELRQRIGLVSASLRDAVPPDERVFDAVVTAAWAVTGRWRENYDPADLNRAHDLLHQMGVLGLADRTFGTLSDGESKRVQIARALMPDPELLILDEPAAGLDLGAREDLVARLGDLAEDPDGPSMLLVTHHLEEIPPGFTHALVLASGRVVASGSIENVLTSDLLSRVYATPIDVRRTGDRWSGVGARAPQALA